MGWMVRAVQVTYDPSGEEEFSIRLNFETAEEAEAFDRSFNGKGGCHDAACLVAMRHFK
jgi:hypothetical protein